jgi:hypothetical protein
MNPRPSRTIRCSGSSRRDHINHDQGRTPCRIDRSQFSAAGIYPATTHCGPPLLDPTLNRSAARPLAGRGTDQWKRQFHLGREANAAPETTTLSQPVTDRHFARRLLVLSQWS